MKVLVAHNRYRSDVPSGENVVVDAEIDQLASAGVDVVPLIADSDTVSLRSPAGLAAAALGPVYAPRGVPELRDLIERERPDVLHLHNVYPLLSPWAVRAAHDLRVPVVQTIHNFRHDCVAGSYFRDGAICTECAGHTVATPAIRHGCYRGSRAQSIPMVVGRTMHRGTWRTVDRYLALTDFHAGFLTSLGVPAERLVVRPTSAPDPGPSTPPTSDDVLFVGRLDEQKGIRLLLDAWRARSHPGGATLHLVGDGPLGAEAERAAERDATLVVHGALPADQVAARIRACGLVVIPSIGLEGLPRVLVEAFSHGRAVAATSLGGLAATVTDDVGWRFAPDAEALASLLDGIEGTRLATKGAAARETFLTTYSPQVTTEQLLAVYAELAGSRG